MISTTENYLCENVSFLGSTLKKHYFLAKNNKITIYIHDNDINQKEIDGFDLKDYTVIKAAVGENKILLEAVNIATKDKRYTIVLSNFEAEKINARVYEWGNVNLTLCILLCNHFYVIKAEEQKLVQKQCEFNANDELEEVENVLSNYNENIAKIDTTDSVVIKVNTQSGKIHHMNISYDNSNQTSLPVQISATLVPSLLQEESSDIIKISKSSLINIGMGSIIIALTIVLIIHCYKTRPTNSTNDILNSATSESKVLNELPHDRRTDIAKPLITNQT
uniref:Uncharacterized protein n=1 Tax=Panagrolaimus davidi TaxID=227884 RepID=A0A914QZR2_9BILA